MGSLRPNCMAPSLQRRAENGNPICLDHKKPRELVCIDCVNEKDHYPRVCVDCIHDKHSGHRMCTWKKLKEKEIAHQKQQLKIFREKAGKMVECGQQFSRKRNSSDLKALKKFIIDCQIPLQSNEELRKMNNSLQRLIDRFKQIQENIEESKQIYAHMNDYEESDNGSMSGSFRSFDSLPSSQQEARRNRGL